MVRIIDMNVVIKNIDGTEAHQRDSDTNVVIEELLRLKNICVAALMNPTPGDKPVTQEMKITKGNLAEEILLSKEPLEMAESDITVIKDLINLTFDNPWMVTITNRLLNTEVPPADKEEPPSSNQSTDG